MREKENLGYWEKTWNLPLADRAETINGASHAGQNQLSKLMSEIYNLIDKNPDDAYEIAQHAIQTKDLLFYSDSGSEREAYSVIMCKAASYDKKVVNLILEHMEGKGFSHSTMFDNRFGCGEGGKFKHPAIYYDLLREQLNEGKIEPARMFEALKMGSKYTHDSQYEKYLNTDYKPESSIRGGTIHESLRGDDENELHRAMADCVIKDPKLWDKFYAHVNATMKMNPFVGQINDLISCCNNVALNNEALPKSFCNDVVDIAKKVVWDYKQRLQPALVQIAIKDHSLILSMNDISRENFDAFAAIYEEYANKLLKQDDNELLEQKNIVLGDYNKNQEIMNTIRDKILNARGERAIVSKYKQVWLVKNAQKFPNLVQDCLQVVDLPYVEMCIRNIENPEKENISSLLNRLQVKKAETFEDFQDAQDFVARRDICMRACYSLSKEKRDEHYKRHTDEDYNNRLIVLDEKQLAYDMAEVGIGNFKTAKRVAELFYTLNERPCTYGSSYNEFYPNDLLPIAKSNVMQDWMYPVMINAIRNEVLSTSEGRMPSERTLFDCCKAWKICPSMPQRLAKEVGTYSLKGRMLAGAIFEQMCEKGKTTSQEWRENKELHQRFYEEFNRAQKMPRNVAFKQYIPNTPVNRKRFVGMGMEEKGIENTPENFKALYKKAREQGIFDKTLAQPQDTKTTYSSRLMVKLARKKNNIK